MKIVRKIKEITQDRKPFKRFFIMIFKNIKLDILSVFKLTIPIQDFKIYLNNSALSLSFFYNPEDRKEDFDFITLYLKPGDTYIDIGANIGTTFIPAVKIIGQKGKAIAFEANPGTYKKFKKNVELNGILNQSTLYNFALGEKESTIIFSNRKSDDTNNVLDEGSGIKIPLKKLDDVLDSNISRIDLLKIDVEGYEKFVLEGAVGILENTKCIFVEISEENFNRYNYTVSDFLAFLIDKGFKLYVLKDTSKLIPIDESYNLTVHHINIIALRNSKDFYERTHIAV